ncbi:MAG: UDP-2,3-diacylglucosamine diphosphatase [Nitrosomonadales bacterium]|nr:UDP-2,3-diacylglucosamine diphosphatase [Nitrosomonadales bacterium]
MPHTLFISDLHLCAGQAHITAAFQRFVTKIAPKAEALYILGDLFEYWAGDDDLDDPLHQQITATLSELAANGTPVFLLHGNRDLLMGKVLAQACGATLLSDPTLVDLYGTPTLLTHGDALCTDDVSYQQFRSQVHDVVWQQNFLAQSLAQRKNFIEQLRARSRNEKQAKSYAIMDVSADAVAALLRQHGYPRLIHGHTHRPARHLLHLDNHLCERWVLGDWDERGYALHCDATGCRVLTDF